MPLSNRSTAGNGNGTSVTLNIPVGSGNNRVVVATAAQQRNTVSISSMTLNGVTGTSVGTVTSSDSFWRAIAYIWLDADLPASAGNYTVAVVGPGVDIGIAAIHYSGAAQNSAPAFATNSATSGATSLSLSPTLTSGAVIVQAGTQNTTTTGAGQTNIYASTATTNTFYMSASFDEADNTVSYTMPSSGYAAIAVAIEQFVSSGLTITSVTPSSFDSGITGIVIAGSGFGASQGSSTVDIGGQAQTVTAWSNTSITITSARGSNSMGAASLKVTVR